MAFLQRHRTARTDEKPSDGASQGVHPRVAATAAAGSAGIIRRVSSIFLPRKKPAPPNLALVSAALAYAPRRASYDSSRASTDSEDDIRIPSGLGSAASDLGSLPSSPFFHAFPTPPVYHRPRSASSPNFETTFNVKMREAPLVVRKAPIPPAVFALVAQHLPRADLAACATLARAYTESARTSLYAHIDLDSLPPPHAEKLLALLAARSDLPALVAAFTCRAWPAFFVPAGSPPPNAHAARLTAALACALARMCALEELTLPAFDVALLARHSAFGLRALTLTARHMSAADTRALFAWLDGQTNVASLRLPHLVDDALAAGPRLPRARSSPHLPPGPAAAAASPRVPAFAPRAPPASALAVQLAARTLLPNLATLHAPPALALLLAAPLVSSAAAPAPEASSLPFPSAAPVDSTPISTPTDSTPAQTGPRRPLASLTITLSTTLYAGLRPATLMGALRGGPTHLSLRIARAVDRRTAEKVVGAVGAALGGGGSAGAVDVVGGEGNKEGGKVAKKRWEGTGRVPFAMPMRASTADLPLPLPTQAADANAPRARTASTRSALVPRAPIVRDEDDAGDEEGTSRPGDSRPTPEEPITVTLNPASTPTKPQRAPSAKMMVTRGPIVPDKHDDEDDAPPPATTEYQTLVVGSIRARTISTTTKKSGMVARAPVVRDEEETEDEDDPVASTLVVESVRVRTVSTATKSGMVARAPVVRDEDEDEDEPVNSTLVVESVRARTISTATKSGMVARAPVVRDEDEDEDEGNGAKGNPALPRVRSRTTTSAAPSPNKRSLPSSPMVARRAPTVRNEDDEDEVGTPADAPLRPRSIASDTSSSHRRANTYKAANTLLLPPLAADAESEYLISPLAAQSFRSRTESTSGASSVPSRAGRMVARAPTVRDDEEEEQEEEVQTVPTGDTAPAPEPRDTSIRIAGVSGTPPLALATAGHEPRARTVSAGSALRRHGRTLSGKLKAMVLRVSRAEVVDAVPPAQPAPEATVGQQWNGLVSLEVVFYAADGDNSAREEAVYRSLSASLARYRSLTSLNLRTLREEKDSTGAALSQTPHPHQELSANEQDLLDAWARLCPNLQSVVLFSGARWQKGLVPPKKPVHVMMQLTAPGQPFLL